jgi:hypothetical protein
LVDRMACSFQPLQWQNHGSGCRVDPQETMCLIPGNAGVGEAEVCPIVA